MRAKAVNVPPPAQRSRFCGTRNRADLKAHRNVRGKGERENCNLNLHLLCFQVLIVQGHHEGLIPALDVHGRLRDQKVCARVCSSHLHWGAAAQRPTAHTHRPSAPTLRPGAVAVAVAVAVRPFAEAGAVAVAGRISYVTPAGSCGRPRRRRPPKIGRVRSRVPVAATVAQGQALRFRVPMTLADRLP